MRVCTVYEPWAQLIAMGVKLVENRGQNVRYRGPVAIQAGKRWSEHGIHDGRVRDAVAARYGSWLPLLRRTFPTGVVLAVAQLIDCHPASDCCTPWGEDVYYRPNGNAVRCHHLVLEDVRPLACPVPARGMRGTLWMPDDDLVTRIEEAHRG